VMGLLVREFCRRGVEVVVASAMPLDKQEYPHVRWVSSRDLCSVVRETRRAGAVLQANISLPTTWFLSVFARRKPYLVVHHTWYRRETGTLGLRDALKLLTSRFTHNVSVSSSIADHLPAPSEVIHNPYDNTLFYHGDAQERARQFLFVGRLVSDKGVDLLLSAFASSGVLGTLTIVGDGPERERLTQQISTLGLTERVELLGTVVGGRLAELYRTSRVVVLPSIWDEPFGVVAVEALACGCVVLAADRRGLREALGENGVFFNPEDPETFAELLKSLSMNARPADIGRERHLAKLRVGQVADRYMAILRHVE
jgi:glycogen(starch) synthase